MKRRHFLVSGAIISAFLSMRPERMLADWSSKLFQQSSLEAAFMNALGTKDLVRSNEITIAAPAVASDSSAVPIEIFSSLKCDQLFLFVEKNLTPLVFKCELHGSMLPYFSLNIKMREGSALYAVVRESGRYFMTSVHIEVVAQAC
jgi:sulfur-oxidizing protein SoxY